MYTFLGNIVSNIFIETRNSMIPIFRLLNSVITLFLYFRILHLITELLYFSYSDAESQEKGPVTTWHHYFGDSESFSEITKVKLITQLW